MLLAISGVVFVGCGGDDDDATEATSAETTTGGDEGEATALEVGAEDYKFVDAPAELEAGLYNLTFTNRGAADHEFGLASIGDTTLEQFQTDFAPVLEGGPIPEYMPIRARPHRPRTTSRA
jgi:hypothetical protein